MRWRWGWPWPFYPSHLDGTSFCPATANVLLTLSLRVSLFKSISLFILHLALLSLSFSFCLFLTPYECEWACVCMLTHKGPSVPLDWRCPWRSQPFRVSQISCFGARTMSPWDTIAHERVCGGVHVVWCNRVRVLSFLCFLQNLSTKAKVLTKQHFTAQHQNVSLITLLPLLQVFLEV